MAMIDIEALSPAQRLELLEPQREELDRRLDDLDAEGPVGIPWEEAYQRLRDRSKAVGS